MLLATTAIPVVPALVGQLVHGDGMSMIVPLAVFSVPTFIVVAVCGLAAQWSAFVGAAASATLALTAAEIAYDLGGTAASDAQGSLVYLVVPVFGVPAAVIGGFVAWMFDTAVDTKKPDSRARPSGKQLMQIALRRIASALETIDGEMLGYPPGTNAVAAPLPPSVARKLLQAVPEFARERLAPLYAGCNGVTASDVHNGYFIAPLERVAKRPPSDPQQLASSGTAICVFGSTGGGAHFAVHDASGVLLLSDEAAVHNGIFEDRPGSVVVIAPDVATFLERIAEDAEAFTCGADGWRFVDAALTEPPT